MSPTLIFFLLGAIATVCVLVWALRPTETVRRPADEILEALSVSRHRVQLPQILRALQPEDLEYLLRMGTPELAAQVRRERRAVALEYLNCLGDEYELLVEAMRILAAMSTDLPALEEWHRFQALARFAVSRKLLSWRLYMGMNPRESFRLLSDSVSSAALTVERATSKIGENAFLTAEMVRVRERARPPEGDER
jgi:hypothetical protein